MLYNVASIQSHHDQVAYFHMDKYYMGYSIKFWNLSAVSESTSKQAKYFSSGEKLPGEVTGRQPKQSLFHPRILSHLNRCVVKRRAKR